MKKRYKAKEISKQQRELIGQAMFQMKALSTVLERISEYADVAAIWNEDMSIDVPNHGGYGIDLPPPTHHYYTKASLVRKRMELVETLREMEKSLKSY